MYLKKTVRILREEYIPELRCTLQHLEYDKENFEYYNHEIDLLNKIVLFLQKLIKECDRIFDTKHDYKVIKVKVEEALCAGTDNTVLEKNLAERGLTYLVKIEEIVSKPPTIR